MSKNIIGGKEIFFRISMKTYENFVVLTQIEVEEEIMKTEKANNT